MKKISIFVAGAKELELQRLKLKALVNDMNADYLKENQMININVHSYENFENNNQNTYNHFIVNDTDLAIFILDGRIGEKTELEYLLATEHFRKCGVPRIQVFVRKYSEITPEIAYINGLIKSNSDDYYTTYVNDYDLMNLARRSIDAAVHEICNLQEQGKNSSVKQSGKIVSAQKGASENVPGAAVEGISCKSHKRNYYKYLVALLLPVSLFLALLNFYPRGENVHLLIAGGGSAANFIDKYAKDSLKYFKGGYYVHQPSRNAWSLLSEEVVTKQSVRKYYPICVSADTINSEDLLDVAKIEHFLAEGVVIGIELGYDTMVVSLQNHPKIVSKLSAECFLNKEISVSTLSQLVKDTSSIKIFATNPGSGTRSNYAKALAKIGFELKDDLLSKFSQDTKIEKVRSVHQPYILLGSKCYQMNDIELELTDGWRLDVNKPES